jgi:ribosomal protein S18 acetylase RimI-like enzyme
MTFVRTARPQDLEQLVELLRLLFAIEEDFNVNADKQRQGLALVLDDERSRVLVAEVHGKVVGMCTGQLVISTAEGGPAVLVEDVVVDPGHRGQGIGRALLDALATWARNQGASRMQLLADTNNRPALVFYDRRGWQRTALICLRRHLSGI